MDNVDKFVRGEPPQNPENIVSMKVAADVKVAKKPAAKKKPATKKKPAAKKKQVAKKEACCQEENLIRQLSFWSSEFIGGTGFRLAGIPCA